MPRKQQVALLAEWEDRGEEMMRDIPGRQRSQSAPQKEQEPLLRRMSELYALVALLAVRERRSQVSRGPTPNPKPNP